MLGLISVETGLDDIKEHLQSAGYTVVDMAEAGPAVEAVIYTGETCISSGSCPRSAADCYAVMVNAAGLTAQQVAEELAVRMERRNIQELPGQLSPLV